MPSKANLRFEDNCGDVGRLLDIHQNLTGNTPGRKWGVEVLNKSAIVLTCAFWEAYIEDVVAEALDFITSNITDADKLPINIRKIVAKAIKQDQNELSPWTLAGDGWKKVLAGNLNKAKAKYLGNWNSPKTANIRSLFSDALGLTDLPAIWKRPYLTAAQSSRKLDDFVTLRGAIAHRGKPASAVKKWMVTAALAHVKELVSFTDSAVNSYVTAATGARLF